MIVLILSNVILSTYAFISSETVGISRMSQSCFVKHTGKD